MRTVVNSERMLGGMAHSQGEKNKAMNPARGPATAAQGRERLHAAHQTFAAACRQVAARGEWVYTPIFGVVLVVDYLRFTGLHTRHHQKQMAAQ